MLRLPLWTVCCSILLVLTLEGLDVQYAYGQSTPQMSVFAGTGRAGLADGPRTSAEFVLPTAMTSDAQGNLYVADSAAQRVRMIDASGKVVTLAGSGTLEPSHLWVKPGYRDGPALQARFYRPSGLAVGPGGELYIADSGNHCIRLLKDGMVSTFAGTCGTSGVKDGTRTEALFSYPRQIVRASTGDLYVADFQSAIRKVDSSGNVTTLPVSVDKRVTGVALDGGSLVIANATGLTSVELASGRVEKVPEYYTARGFPPPIAGGVELGSPYALAAGPDADGVFYTDLNADAVRHVFGTNFLEYISGVPREDAPLGTAYLSSTPPLHGPMGITLDGRGNLYVADSGHKRIISIQGFYRRRGFLHDPMSLLTLQPKRNAYRILIIGNSFVWFTNQESDSIGARLQRTIQRSQAASVPSLQLLSLQGGGIAGQASLANELIAQTDVDFVVIFVTSFDMWHFTGQDFKEQFRRQEANTVSALKAASKSCLFVFIPAAWESTPYEQLYSWENMNQNPSDYASVPPQVVEQLQGIGAPILDLFPAVQAYEADPYVRSLYNNYDLHPNANGREFIAEHIAAALLKLEPWKTGRPAQR